MANNQRDNKVGDLYELLLDDLLDQLKSGDISPADRKLIVQIARDHGMQIDKEAKGNFLEGLEEHMGSEFPFKSS
jgi:hypothetical protein